MKTKTIFKTLAMAMMMPAMMLTTACSSDDDAIANNPENNNQKGYAIPVTVNVTRQGDATTRAEYNESTKELAFSTGDQLFVQGSGHPGAGQFAGTLEWQSGGTFSGTIYTQYEYTGTADALLTGAGSHTATLLPDGTSRFTMIEKQQSFASYMPTPEDWKPTSISYSAFAQGNDMYFLFNDDPKNIPYPGKSVVYCPSGMSFKKKWESVLMKLTPDQKLTQRVLPDPNQLLRGVEFTDGENFYASGVGKSEFFMTKYAIEE